MARNAVFYHAMRRSQSRVTQLFAIMASKAILTASIAHIDLCHFFIAMATLALKHRRVSAVIFIINIIMATRTIPTTGKPKLNTCNKRKYQSFQMLYLKIKE